MSLLKPVDVTTFLLIYAGVYFKRNKASTYALCRFNSSLLCFSLLILWQANCDFIALGRALFGSCILGFQLARCLPLEKEVSF